MKNSMTLKAYRVLVEKSGKSPDNTCARKLWITYRGILAIVRSVLTWLKSANHPSEMPGFPELLCYEVFQLAKCVCTAYMSIVDVSNVA